MTIKYFGRKDGEFAYVYVHRREDPFLVTPSSKTPFEVAERIAKRFDFQNPTANMSIIRHNGKFSQAPEPHPRPLQEIIEEIKSYLASNRTFRGR